MHTYCRPASTIDTVPGVMTHLIVVKPKYTVLFWGFRLLHGFVWFKYRLCHVWINWEELPSQRKYNKRFISRSYRNFIFFKILLVRIYPRDILANSPHRSSIGVDFVCGCFIQQRNPREHLARLSHHCLHIAHCNRQTSISYREKMNVEEIICRVQKP